MQRRDAILALSFAPLLSAKGNTVKIVIQGGKRSKPLVLTGEKVGEFGIWEGPGVFRNRIEETEGFIAEWSKGVVSKLPKGLRTYEVSFYIEGDSAEKASLGYIVKYAFDPASGESYVYLYSRDEPEALKNRMWHGHRYDGVWLRATPAWASYVNPLLAKAN